jgi:hypothetical protein
MSMERAQAEPAATPTHFQGTPTAKARSRDRFGAESLDVTSLGLRESPRAVNVSAQRASAEGSPARRLRAKVSGPMRDDAPPPEDGEAPDVVLLHSPTADGEGVRVLRAREGRLEAGEVRPVKEGQPLVSGELVTLTPREEAPALCDVKVQFAAPTREAAANPAPAALPHKGPALVNSQDYRERWDAIFGATKPHSVN